MEIDRILYPTDFSEQAEAALPHALWFAEEFGAELLMLHALVLHAADPGNPKAAFPDLEVAYGEVRDWAAERLTEAVERVDRPAVTVRQVQERGISAPPVILDYVRDNDIDLVVLGTHGRRGVRRMLLGSVTEEVLRAAPCPVLTVRDGEREHGEPPKRILVPMDFSEYADAALRRASELAERTGAEIVALHVLHEVAYPDPYFAEAATLRAVAKAAREEVPVALARKVDEVLGEGASDEVETLLEIGPPAATIADFAEEEDVDLVVMASHGRTGVERAFIGSVTEGVVRRAECPVLVVRADGERLDHGRGGRNGGRSR